LPSLARIAYKSRDKNEKRTYQRQHWVLLLTPKYASPFGDTGDRPEHSLLKRTIADDITINHDPLV
jgi:hypothetical protein